MCTSILKYSLCISNNVCKLPNNSILVSICIVNRCHIY